jgi:peptide chain release factor subunit 1
MSRSHESTQLKRQLARLKRFTSRSTSLVSLYVPGTTAQINLALTNLKQELSVIGNVKSAQTRKSVKSALLKLQNKIGETKFPKNGLAFFCGEDNSTSKIECVVVEPPNPLQSRYKCEKFFLLHPLERMLVKGQLVGVVLFDGQSFVLGEVQDSRRDVFSQKSITVPNKHRRGGQSAARFGRLRV